jgi:hypothetical protein
MASFGARIFKNERREACKTRGMIASIGPLFPSLPVTKLRLGVREGEEEQPQE